MLLSGSFIDDRDNKYVQRDRNRQCMISKDTTKSNRSGRCRVLWYRSDSRVLMMHFLLRVQSLLSYLDSLISNILLCALDKRGKCGWVCPTPENYFIYQKLPHLASLIRSYILRFHLLENVGVIIVVIVEFDFFFFKCKTELYYDACSIYMYVYIYA